MVEKVNSGSLGATAVHDAWSVAARMAEAAEVWLASLTYGQRRVALYPCPLLHDDSERERVTWFYTPTDHGGLPLGSQAAAQQQRAMALLATGLSLEGYVAVSTVMGLENVLDRIEGFRVQWDRERGRDSGLYFVRVFGDPRKSSVWGWRFAGHHVSANFLIVDGRVVSNRPFFMGADPASIGLPGGVELSPLGGLESLARSFAGTLTPEQSRRMQILDRAVSDIVSGNRVLLTDGDRMIHMQDLWRAPFEDPSLAELVDKIDQRAEAMSAFTVDDHRAMSYTEVPKGLCGAGLDDRQRSALRALTYAASAGPLQVDVNQNRWDDDNLDNLHIAWGGPLAETGPLYFRLQGPRLFFEYDNTQRDGNHVHTVLRDPLNDFGFDALRLHRSGMPHG